MNSAERTRRRRWIALLVAGFALAFIPVLLGTVDRVLWTSPAATPEGPGGPTSVSLALGPDGSTPVWVQITSASPATVSFTQGPWSRDVSVEPGTTIYSIAPRVDLADPEPPLVITGTGVAIETGVGRRPGASPLNDGWTFTPRGR